MRVFIVILSLSLTKTSFTQNKIAGHYHDYFSSNLYLNFDSTYKYAWNADMLSSWTKGIWRFKNDTIFLTMIPVYDTMRYHDKNDTIFDKLILSDDEQPNVLFQNNIDTLRSRGQNFEPAPDSLFYRKNKLYLIKNGQILRRKIKGPWTNKKRPHYYVKSQTDSPPTPNIRFAARLAGRWGNQQQLSIIFSWCDRFKKEI